MLLTAYSFERALGVGVTGNFRSPAWDLTSGYLRSPWLIVISPMCVSIMLRVMDSRLMRAGQ